MKKFNEFILKLQHILFCVCAVCFFNLIALFQPPRQVEYQQKKEHWWEQRRGTAAILPKNKTFHLKLKHRSQGVRIG